MLFRLGLTLCLLLLTGCQLITPPIPSSEETGDTFRKTFGTNGTDAGEVLLQLPGGDLLIAGSGNGILAPADGTLPTPNLTRIRRDGELLWSQVYDSLRYARAAGVLEHPEGFVLLISRSDDRTDYGGGVRGLRLQVWLVDTDGHLVRLLYDRPGSHVSYAASRSFVATPDGGYALTGLQRDDDVWPGTAFVAKLDEEGILAWETPLEALSEPNALHLTPDGGFVIAGTGLDRSTDAEHDEHFILYRVAPDGTVSWTRTYGDGAAFTERARALDATSNGYIIAGYRIAPEGEHEAYAVWIDENGQRIRDRAYGEHGDNEELLALTTTTDGGVVFAGTVRPESRSASRALYFKVDREGDVVWSHDIQANQINYTALDILELSDGYLALTGSFGPNIPTYGGADYDVFMFVVDTGGQ